MNAETLFKAFLEVVTATVNFEKKTKKEKEKTVLDAAVKFKPEQYSWYNNWFWEKCGKDCYYDGDIFALLGFGASGETEIFIIKYILGLPDENIFCKDYLERNHEYSETLKEAAVFYNNNSIPSAFESDITPFLKKNKINPFGCPKNWAKLIIALNATGKYDAEKMVRFSFL